MIMTKDGWRDLGGPMSPAPMPEPQRAIPAYADELKMPRAAVVDRLMAITVPQKAHIGSAFHTRIQGTSGNSRT